MKLVGIGGIGIARSASGVRGSVFEMFGPSGGLSTLRLANDADFAPRMPKLTIDSVAGSLTNHGGMAKFAAEAAIAFRGCQMLRLTSSD